MITLVDSRRIVVADRPEDLVVQVPVLKKIIAARRIPLFEYADYEADDVLATLARLAAERDLCAVVVTTDKDLLQILGPRVVIYNPAKEFFIVDDSLDPECQQLFKNREVKTVSDYFGLPAHQVADVLGRHVR